jgi:hypothetical protein
VEFFVWVSEEEGDVIEADFGSEDGVLPVVPEEPAAEALFEGELGLQGQDQEVWELRSLGV